MEPDPTPDTVTTYTVKPGDSIPAIAKKV
jgi:LysM repeat protein